MDSTLEGPDGQIRYLDRPGLAGLILKNLLLTALTLGIYRFWARTRLRRFFWSNIEIDGEPLEYTGTGGELFIGFLIALAILAPIFVIYAVAQRLAQTDPRTSAILTVVYFTAFISFIQFARYRSRRYRLSRTLWRGIRAGQSGSAWRYLALAWGWGLVTALTLGIAAPWAAVALERYKIQNTWFGNARFELTASAAALLPRWLIALGALFVPMMLAIAVNHRIYPSVPGHPAPLPHPFAFTFFFLVAGLAGVPAFIAYRVALFRTVASGMSLGDSRIHSAARPGTVIGTVLLFGLGLAGIGFVVSMVGAAVFAFVHGLLGPSSGTGFSLAAGATIGVIGYVISVQLLQTILLTQGIIRHLANTMAIDNAAALAAIAKSPLIADRFGEGLADSVGVADGFDLGAI